MTTSDTEIISQYWRIDGNNGEPLCGYNSAEDDLAILKRFLAPPHVVSTACENPYWFNRMKEVALDGDCFSAENPDDEIVTDADLDDGDNGDFENEEHECRLTTPRYYIFALLCFNTYPVSLSLLRTRLINHLDDKDETAAQYILHKSRFVPLSKNEFYAQNRTRDML